VLAFVEAPPKHSQILEASVLGTTPEALTAFTIERRNSATGTVTAGQEVTYTLTVTNTSESSVYNTVLTDDLVSPSGEVLHTEGYLLGEVFPGEEITIEYTVLFDQTLEDGVYTSSATLSGSESPDSVELLSDASVDFVTFVKALPPAEPAKPAEVQESEPIFELPALIPVAEAYDGSGGGEGFSSQGASIGALGLTTNHLLLFIILLYLSYVATRHYRRKEPIE